MPNARMSTLVAATLLGFCVIMWFASYNIRDLGFDGMPAHAWPQFIIVALGAVSLLYFVQSALAWRKSKAGDIPPITAHAIWDCVKKYRNALWCFGLFFGFLGTLPLLGMLVGGVLFTFLLLCILGGWSLRQLLLHACLSVISIGAMWSIFTFGLRVFLPEGSLFSGF